MRREMTRKWRGKEEIVANGKNIAKVEDREQEES